MYEYLTVDFVMINTTRLPIVNLYFFRLKMIKRNGQNLKNNSFNMSVEGQIYYRILRLYDTLSKYKLTKFPYHLQLMIYLEYIVVHDL